MSVNALEKALWQVYMQPNSKESYDSNAQAYLANFKLTDAERNACANIDVPEMINLGANPLLVMMFCQTVQGLQCMPEYFATVNGMLAQK